MKGSAATMAALLSATAAAQFVLMDIAKRPYSNSNLRRRANSVQSDISNQIQDGGYFIDVTVGTPGQKFSLQLDTGSSDVWVPDSGSAACQAKGSGPKRPGDSNGCSKGSFTSSQSSTFQKGQQGTFKIQYVDESSASGEYFRDNFEVGGVTIKNLTMGLAEQTDIPFGLVGIGYRTNEASIQTVQATYPNLPIAMQSSGNIKTVAYSLWLNDLDANTGSLLFGAIDTEKYQGDLALLDLIPNSQINQVVEFNVPLTSVAGYSSTGSDAFGSTSYPVTVLLDSGTTLSYLPVDLTNQIWQEVGAAYIGQIGVAVVPCALANANSYFSFGFGGPHGPLINVTMDELVLDSISNLPFPSGKFRGKASCTFGIQAQAPNDDGSSPTYLLGDTFLRSAYVVYDLVNNQVGLAQTKVNVTASNVIPFPSNGATVPSSTLVPGQNASSNSEASSTPAFKASGGFQNDAAPLLGLSALGLVAASMATFLAIFASTV